jgi:glycosyltransferase involved in cell wall biosynthesis
VLEAMASGATVVTTRFLALPEVGGDVAIYTDPDATSIANAIRSAIAESGSRSAAGVARAATFSWSASARTHAQVFTTAAGAN